MRKLILHKRKIRVGITYLENLHRLESIAMTGNIVREQVIKSAMYLCIMDVVNFR